ncbi:MAG: phage integrase SAM-like domain-containing protein [Prevotellaceae bacterium]|jgi:hypothetical protein|nr:phage integrase SAM-like domain-containing protein [Prevotellaceae bacterium]
MASSYIFLDTRAPRKDGSFPVKIAILHRTKVYINLKIYLTKEQLVNGKVANHPQKAYYNNLIKYKTSKIDNALIELGIDGRLNGMSALQVKAFIENDGENEEVVQPITIYTFQQACQDFMVMPKKTRTKEIYAATLNKVNGYAGDALAMLDINHVWLSKFGEYLESQGLTINAQALHYRNIRAVFNYAIDEGKVSLNDYPFRRFKIRVTIYLFTPNNFIHIKQV